MKDGQLFHVLTYGQGAMSDFVGQLSVDSRWDVINYIRSLQAQAATNVANQQNEEVPATTQTDNERQGDST